MGIAESRVRLAGVAERNAGRLGSAAVPGPAAILRSLVLGATVFIVAALTGALLSGTAPASTHDPALVRPARADVAPGHPAPADPGAGGPALASAVPPPGRSSQAGAADHRFAQSMVYSGTAALTVSVVGLVIVGRRRRLW